MERMGKDLGGLMICACWWCNGGVLGYIYNGVGLDAADAHSEPSNSTAEIRYINTCGA